MTLLGSIICLLLVLDVGGLKYPWNNGRTIALPVIAFVLMICFITVQIVWSKTATVTPRIFVQRSIMVTFFAMFAGGATVMSTLYYLPISFQSVKGASAVGSGIRLLPTIIGQAAGSLTGGIGIQKV